MAKLNDVSGTAAFAMANNRKRVSSQNDHPVCTATRILRYQQGETADRSG